MVDLVNTARWTSQLDASNWESGAQKMEASSDQVTASVTRMDVATQKAGRNTVLTQGGLQRFAAQLDGNYSAQQRFNAQLDKYNSYVAAGFTGIEKDIAGRALQLRAVQSLGLGLVGLGGTMKEAETVERSMHGATSTATREFRALFDELSSGRTRMTPGTLAIIATRVFGVSGATLAWGAAILAIPVAFGVAAYMAENALDRIGNALKRTAYQSGVTRDQILAIAKGADAAYGISERSAITAATALVGRGNVGRAQLPSAIQASYGYENATGLSADKAAEEFEKLLADPAKGAASLNDNFHLLDVATTRQIDVWAASGEKQKAQQAIIDAVNGRFSHLEDSAWSLAKTFDGAGKWISDKWFHTGTALTGDDQTDAQRLANMRRQYQAMSQPNYVEPALNSPILRAALLSQINALAAKIASDTATAIRGEQRKNSNDAIGAGMALVDKYDKQAKAAQNLAEEISVANKAVNEAKASHSQFTNKLIAERDALVTASKNVKTPAQIAAEEAHDALTVANTPIANRATVQARLAAQREMERNLADPSMSPYAASIYSSKMLASTAKDTELASRTAAAAAKKLAEQELALAKARQKVANDNAKIIDNARAKVIATLYPGSVDARGAAIEQEQAKVRLPPNIDFRSANGLSQYDAYLAERGSAGTLGGQQFDADLTKGISLSPQGAALMDLQKYSAQFDALNRAYPEAQRGTLDYQVKLEGLTESMRKAGMVLDPLRQSLENIATGLGDNVTRGLDSMVFDHAKPGQALRQFGLSETKDLFKNFVDDPLKKSITKGAENIFGIGKPDGSQFNPLYVTMTGAGGLPLTSAMGGGGVGDFLNNIFGDGINPVTVTPEAGASSSGGFFSSIGNFFSKFAGMFDDGGTIGPGQWGIKSGMPEIIQGGTAGVSVAPLSAPSYSASSGNYRGGDVTVSIDARGAQQGVGDEIVRKLMPMMHQIAKSHVVAAAPAIISASQQSVSSKLHNTGRGALSR